MTADQDMPGTAGRGLLALDRDGRIAFANAMACRLCGAMPGTLTGRTLGDLLDSATAAALLAVVRGGAPAAASVAIAGLDGRRRTVRVEAACDRDADGGPTGAILLLRGAAAGPEAVPAAAAESPAAALQVVLQHMRQGVSVFGADLTLRFCNDRFRALLDLPDELTRSGTRLDDIIRFQAASGEFGPVDPEAEVARRRRLYWAPWLRSWERRRPTGRWIEILRDPLPDGGFVSLYADITERKQAELDLRVAKDQAEAANRAKSDFLAQMSHELRTPLNAIIGFSELMQVPGFVQEGSDKVAEYAGDIHRSGELLLALVNEVLDLAKIEAGRFELQETAVDVRTVVHGAARLLRDRAYRKGLEFIVQAGPMPAVRADRRALKQIVLNLLSNAVKFTEAGGTVTVAACLDGGVPTITVRDTGIGIPRDEIPRVLEAFGQASNAPMVTEASTGLGLPIAASLARLHGGDIAIDSDIGQGTLVTVRLPGDRVLDGAVAD